MAQTIDHEGVVQTISDQQVGVLIVQSSACSGCAAKSLCASAESKEKLIEVSTPDAARFSVGEHVRVVGRLSDGLHAAWLAYALPLIILLAVLVAVYVYTQSEWLAALCALASLVPYYLVLMLVRARLQRRFTFRLEKN